MRRWTAHHGESRTYGWSGSLRRFGWRLTVWKHASGIGDRWVVQPTIHVDRRPR